jgi:trehalose synthase
LRHAERACYEQVPAESTEISNAATDEGWRFLWPYVDRADKFVFSRQSYAPAWLDLDRVAVIPPSIDPFSAKNRDLDEETTRAVLVNAGLIDDGRSARPSDGDAGIIADGPPPPPDVPLVVQVSRWDRLKDMPGVMKSFARCCRPTPPPPPI